MSIDIPFTKENLEGYLKELAKEYRKRGHGAPAEMILVGGRVGADQLRVSCLFLRY